MHFHRSHACQLLKFAMFGSFEEWILDIDIVLYMLDHVSFDGKYDAFIMQKLKKHHLIHYMCTWIGILFVTFGNCQYG